MRAERHASDLAFERAENGRAPLELQGLAGDAMRGEWSGPGRIAGRGRRHRGLQLQVECGFHLRRIAPQRSATMSALCLSPRLSPSVIR
jgi:hypothetical protein